VPAARRGLTAALDDPGTGLPAAVRVERGVPLPHGVDRFANPTPGKSGRCPHPGGVSIPRKWDAILTPPAEGQTTVEDMPLTRTPSATGDPVDSLQGKGIPYCYGLSSGDTG